MTQKTEVNDTVRRYPRSLDEAFGFGPEYGCAITGYKRVGRGGRILAGLFIVGVITLIFVNVWRLYE